MASKARQAEEKVYSSDEESGDSDSPKIFQNDFSDTDDEAHSAREISIVKNANIQTSSLPSAAECSSTNEKLETKIGELSNKSPYKTATRISEDTPIRTDLQLGDDKNIWRDGFRREEFGDQSTSFYSDSTESFNTSSEDDYSISDDDDLQHWKPISNPSKKQKNKNFIPVGKTRTLNQRVECAHQSEQSVGYPADVSRHTNDYPSYQNQERFDAIRHNNMTNDTPSDDGGYRTEENKTNHSLSKQNSKSTDIKATSYPQRRTQLSTNSFTNSFHGFSSNTCVNPAEGHSSFGSQANTSLLNKGRTYQHTNSTDASFKTSSYMLQTRPTKPIKSTKSRQDEHVQSFPLSSQTTDPCFSEMMNDSKNRQTTGFQSHGLANKSSGLMFESGEQPGSFHRSDFYSWIENWTTDDYLVCPNFLAGAANEEFNSRYKTGNVHHEQRSESLAKHLTSTERMPRMFHRRVKQSGERDILREHRFSDVAAMMNTPLTELFQVVKATGMDVTKLLENADRLGLPASLPCMQCYEGSGLMEGSRGFVSDYGQSPDGRCARCGGQLQTFASMGKSIVKLRKTIAENKFVIRDVYADGNCMFGSVIDQLRVRGDFLYTVRSLRAAVVDYLRQNPTAEDGTPLEMFLTNESWEDYLLRMSQDGQWGDHMVLNAMTNVLNTRIVIYGGRSGETETVLVPKEFEGTEAAQSDTRTADTIYMGHFGETHYVSFRPENWWNNVQDRNKQALSEWESHHFDPSKRLFVPIPHLDFILRYTFQLEHISNFVSAIAEIPDDDGQSEFKVTLVGPIMCKMAPDYSSQVESISPDVSVFFPNALSRKQKSSYVLSNFQIPNDTVVQDGPLQNKPLNLLTEKTSNPAIVRLLPVNAALWRGQTIQTHTGSTCLKATDIECFSIEGKPVSLGNEELTLHRILAFKCMWPDAANEWTQRGRISGKPDEQFVRDIASEGCHTVPITTNGNQSNVIDSYITIDMINSQELWSFSFAVAETKLSKILSASQRCCFLLFKSLLDFTCTHPPLPAALSKSVFFYACENIVEAVWRYQPGRCLIVMLEKLYLGLERNFIPHYFFNVQNLLHHIPAENIALWSTNLKGIIRQPVISLYFVLDMLDVTSSEIGAVFDDIIDDLPKFNCHRSIDRSFNESYIPTAGTLIDNLVMQREFHFALVALEDIYEQICQFSKAPVDLAKVMKTLLQNMVIGYRWCFGLYVDLLKGTTVTREIAGVYEVVHITEIFGPDVGENDGMPNTVVPACYSITSGDLKFPTVCADVMINAGKEKLLAKFLRYYIDTYGALAGDNMVFGQQMYCIQKKLKYLQGLYVTLLETYVDLGRADEFRALMPNFATITELRQIHAGFHDLAWAWDILGEPEKAVECCPCHNRHKQGGMSMMVEQLLAGLSGYGY